MSGLIIAAADLRPVFAVCACWSGRSQPSSWHTNETHSQLRGLQPNHHVDPLTLSTTAPVQLDSLGKPVPER